MVANVQFQTEGSLVIRNKSIPVTAVQKAADGSLFVWVVTKDSTVSRAKVTIGTPHGNNVGLISGVDMGQRIVTEGYQKLSEGSRVTFK
jgi:multidrug efflux pump subunit AcrA (membrane-fusion protein)